MRVLIVDDSVVFRSQIKASLEGIEGIEVVGAANNGKIALQKLAQSSVDLITLDMEMPEMGGLETIREIKKAKFPLKIIVFSSTTTRGSEAALEALAAGAHDFVAKPSGSEMTFENAATKIREELLPKIKQFLPRPTAKASVSSLANLGVAATQSASPYPRRDLKTFNPSVLVIGSSTGGPPALEAIVRNLSLPVRIPILITQHMPPVFTASLAKRLMDQSGIEAAEAKHGEEIKPNRIYVAPGDFHMGLEKRGTQVYIRLDKNAQRNSVRPAVDVLFETAAEIYTYRTLGVVLTGMGEDGLVGARAIKEKGGGIMIQDQMSCVVFGMPGAIFQAGIHDDIGNLAAINELIRKVST